MTEDKLQLRCEVCAEETAHRVLHIQAGDGVIFTVKCRRCGTVSKQRMERERVVERDYVLSRRGVSSRGKLRLFERELLEVGEEIYITGERAVITALETGEGRRKGCAASELRTLWAKWQGKCSVHISVNRGANTLPLTVEAEPEEEFVVGDVLESGREKFIITSIKTERGLQKRGVAQAKEIVRIYARMAR